ncbi:MAG: Gfo/Idh/MocA family oxidoreductase [Candidatus Aminicenantes bacterium]|nr:Gfo/Idh/MocA family oxidoreductase [Candidatus Aminicenantes bacterium]
MIEGQESLDTGKKLKYGMIGGGQGAFIGDVHRKSIALDGKAEIVAGCFSQDYKNTLVTGKMLDLDEGRLYRSYNEMLEAESKREDKIDFVIIVTPNKYHYGIARAALENGFHVVCDKPVTTRSEDACELDRLSRDKDLFFCVTYTYTGYPMIKHIRDMIAHGVLGEIHFINGEYPQDWLATKLEETGQKQAAWRTDPCLAGISNCVGDIGSHIENMVSYLTGLKIKSLCARLDNIIPSRPLDDNASVMLEYDNGAKGLYWSSQIAVGNDNPFRVRIFGSKAGVEWCQETPNHCRFSYIDKPTELISRGRDQISPQAQRLSRIPSGHPEGYFEAFANIYSVFITALAKKIAGEPLDEEDRDFPGIEEGIQGVKFIEKCVESSKKGAIWIDF